jgi:hypothetical protein
LGEPIDGQIEAPADEFPVSVVMERRQVSDNRWITESWDAVGVTLGDLPGPGPAEPRLLVEGPQAAQYLWTGLKVRLYPDEAESYYHNLMVGSPGCYVLVRPREDGMPRPVLVTLSFDAGQAYQEGGETVYNVPLPPPLYRAAEAFVLAHYCPEQRRKRQLTDWTEDGHAGH